MSTASIKHRQLPRIELVVLLAEIVYMTLELVAARIMSPFFGNTNAVWTAVIGIILASSAIGNWLGGKLADGGQPTAAFHMLLLGSAVTIALLPLASHFILPQVAGLATDARLEATMATILLFFIPSLLLGMITPIAIKLKLEDVLTAGTTAGNIYAVSTVGGIFGTFLSGFFLIPYFPTSRILYISAALTAFLPLLLPPPKPEESQFQERLVKVCAGMLGAAIIAVTVLSSMLPENISSAYENETIIYETDSEYNKLQVSRVHEPEEDEDLLLLRVGISGYQSLSYADDSRKYELPIKGKYYVSTYDTAFDSRYVSDADTATNSLMIGGGGYAYPRHYISTYSNKRLDVVEIDPKVTEVAKRYFYLDDLIEDYGLEEGLDGSGRLGLICDDGRMVLANCADAAPGKYDRIFNDSFSGATPPATLTTVEAAELIEKCLDEDGIYLSNVIGAYEGRYSRFLHSETLTLQQVFEHVYVVPTYDFDIETDTRTARTNWMLVATNAATDFSDIAVDIDCSDGMVLTDEYCPIDSLTEPY